MKPNYFYLELLTFDKVVTEYAPTLTYSVKHQDIRPCQESREPTSYTMLKVWVCANVVEDFQVYDQSGIKFSVEENIRMHFYPNLKHLEALRVSSISKY